MSPSWRRFVGEGLNPEEERIAKKEEAAGHPTAKPEEVNKLKSIEGEQTEKPAV
jgi:hypothetical protein